MKILCVEDERIVGEVFCDLVRELGHEAICCSGAFEAAELLTTQPFDLMFTDVNLGAGPDGKMLAAQMKSRWPDMPVILITGYLSPDDGLSANHVLLKPCTLGMVEAAINSACPSRQWKNTGHAR